MGDAEVVGQIVVKTASRQRVENRGVDVVPFARH